MNEAASISPDDLLQRFAALKSIRASWETMWTDIAKYVMPRRSPGMGGSVMSPSSNPESLLFDTTAVRANMTLANGQMAWMTPLESSWFAFEPALRDRTDSARVWLAACTEVAREALASSNFYTAIHEGYLDRGGFGTQCLYIELGRKNDLNCQHWPIGTYVIDEDADGNIDTVIREFELTARQAVQKFGKENLSENIQKAAEKAETCNSKFWFLHAIMPREDSLRKKEKKDAENMPIASIYMERDGKKICRTSGYEEMPVMVTRYLEWGTGMGGLYGWSPSFAALPEARQLNFIQEMMDALAEKTAFPPVLSPEELEGEIDSNASGVTYFSKDLNNSLPKEWQTAGRYDVGVDRVKEKQAAINDAFHVDLFQMFAQIDKQMTAREVAERSSEKLIQFSPTFARLTGELLNPLLERVFNILFRMGKFPPVPEDIGENGFEYKMQYTSRIALALRSLPSIGWQRTLERLGATAQFNPEVLDLYDFDKAERSAGLADGVAAEVIRPMDQVQKIRADRAEQQAAAMQQQQALMAADAASKLSRIPADSPAAKAIESQMKEAA
jgi:hypothetical protein